MVIDVLSFCTICIYNLCLGQQFARATYVRSDWSHKMGTVLELSYILALRGIPVASNPSKQFLVSQLGDITAEEENEVAKWMNIASNSEIIRPWIQEDMSLPNTLVIVRALAMKTGHQCLIPSGTLNKGTGIRFDAAGQRLAIAYYAARGYSHEPMFQSLTTEQSVIANYGNAPITNAPCYTIVRAGPGTGKTSTAVELIRTCVKTGQTVLLIAYTNSAVTTVRRRIGADPYLGNRYKSDPFSAKNSENHDRRQVMLSTIDTVARAILTGGGKRKVATGLSFDDIIRNALAMVKSDKRALSVFRDPDGTPMFTHFIVDETQMLCDDRADLVRQIAYGLGVSGINGTKSCHLTMFCDPKQTIASNAGQWLVDIYKSVYDAPSQIHSITRTSDGSIASIPVKIATFEGKQWCLYDLTKSFRFATQAMLEYVMYISRARPHLHVELESGREFVTSNYPPAYARSVADIELIADDIGHAYHTTSSVGILTPTIGRTNRISGQVNAIILELRRRKIPVCTQEDNNYHANGVVVTTFNSCAGMEFSHVFICGVSGYPKSNPQIPAETGRSLMFVANSRAKVSICYIVDKMELCVDVDNSRVVPMMTTQLDKYTIPDKYDPKLPDYWTPDILFRDGTGARFMAVNGVSYMKHTIMAKFENGAKTALFEAVSQYKNNIVLVDGNRSSGLAIDQPSELSMVSRMSSSIKRINPNVAYMKGAASRGRICMSSRTSRVTNDDNQEWAFELPAGTTNESFDIHSNIVPEHMSQRNLFYWLSNLRPEPFDSDTVRRAATLMDLLRKTLCDYETSITGNLPPDNIDVAKYTPIPMVHEMRNPKFNDVKHISNHMVLSPDATISVAGRDAYVTYTLDPYVAMYMSALTYMSSGAAPLAIQVDYANGIIRIFDGFHARMGYLLDALRRVHIYYMTTVFKQNFLGIPPDKRPSPNAYAVDTEYTDGGVLYEIGMVCMDDPFRSMCTLLQNTDVTADVIARSGLSMAAYKTIAMSIMELILMFLENARAATNIPELIYLSATADVKWATDTGAITTNILDVVGKDIIRNGTFESDSKSSDLKTLYGAYVGTMNNSGRHRAFPDAVALAEIYIAHLHVKSAQ